MKTFLNMKALSNHYSSKCWEKEIITSTISDHKEIKTILVDGVLQELHICESCLLYEEALLPRQDWNLVNRGWLVTHMLSDTTTTFLLTKEFKDLY
jgi:hypothetical protein